MKSTTRLDPKKGPQLVFELEPGDSFANLLTAIEQASSGLKGLIARYMPVRDGNVDDPKKYHLVFHPDTPIKEINRLGTDILERFLAAS